jgi:hypothetical protein
MPRGATRARPEVHKHKEQGGDPCLHGERTGRERQHGAEVPGLLTPDGLHRDSETGECPEEVVRRLVRATPASVAMTEDARHLVRATPPNLAMTEDARQLVQATPVHVAMTEDARQLVGATPPGVAMGWDARMSSRMPWANSR